MKNDFYDKFKEMYELQDKLNINTCGANWTSGVTKDDRDINWFRAMYLESAEAIESTNWKHWKNINEKDDLDNVKVELVDIWHFLMSAHIAEEGSVEKAVKSMNETYSMFLREKMSVTPVLIFSLENIIEKAVRYNMPTIDFFWAIDAIEGFSMDEVYKLYLGKNCLNKFRQDNGYKDGTYIKTWGKREDNVFMKSCVDTMDNLSYDTLYELLDTRYKEVKEIKTEDAA